VSHSDEEDGRPAPPSPEVVIARARVHSALICVFGILVVFVGLGVFALMLVPLAHAIAGRHTDFSFTFSLSVNVALAVSTALAGAGLAVQTRRASRHKQRAGRLEAQLGYAEKRLPAAEGQIGRELPET
jgi:membrane protein implicated in regulation of membrane protease activity